MALHRLTVDDFYDGSFTLIAIHSRIEDYRLAYLLNKKLGLKLKRRPNDLDVDYSTASYSIFEWKNETRYETWNLVSNLCKKEESRLQSTGLLFNDEKSFRTHHLISEYKNVDFFIKIANDVQDLNEKAILKTLQTIPQIITSYTVDPLNIKSKDHLIF